MIRPIYLYGSEVLRQVAVDADLSKKDEITELVRDLKDTLAHADGCGLAAPQIGVGLRVVIVDGTGMVDIYDYLKGFKRTLINPVIVESSPKSCEYSEGCLSLPGLFADVRRPSEITVEYYDESLKKVTETFDKFACRMVQHEISHLDGDLFVDHVAPIRKKMIAKKLQNISRGKVSTYYTTKIK
ncbi:MAG: peptide deformylase [Bacteroidales bacterium]|jgi:peptide deformylase|nr:peptide deformylase [Bacteroidales bacterium]MCI1785396.1 peptide deformylase [Bacteroidales bacterium]